MRKSGVPTTKSSDFTAVFDQLRQLLRDKAAGTKLTATADEPGNYSLTAGYSERFKKDLWFGGVRTGKAYVSLHLMPLYMNPKMLDGMSEQLRARMRGKSCFNFRTSLEPVMLSEVGDLIERCIRGFSTFVLPEQQKQQQQRMKHGAAKIRSGARRSKAAS